MMDTTDWDSELIADLAPERSWPGEAQMMRICGERPYTRQGYEETNFRWSFAQTDGLAAIRPRPVSGPVRRDSWVVMTARIWFLGGFRRFSGLLLSQSGHFDAEAVFDELGSATIKVFLAGRLLLAQSAASSFDCRPLSSPSRRSRSCPDRSIGRQPEWEVPS